MKILALTPLLAGLLLTSIACGAEDNVQPRTGKKADENLSEKLDKGKGVIIPPAEIDKGIAKPAPELPNSTPVIPPQAPGAK